jgi:hypothetical protein
VDEAAFEHCTASDFMVRSVQGDFFMGPDLAHIYIVAKWLEQERMEEEHHAKAL